MGTLRKHLRDRNVSPRILEIAGSFHPQYLVLNIDYESSIWEALREWAESTQGTARSIDLADPLENLGARALILREHELAHFFSFLLNPFASVIQCLSLIRDSCYYGAARVVKESGASSLRLPLKTWRDQYKLDKAHADGVEHFENVADTCSAVLGMLMFGLRDVRIPDIDRVPHAVKELKTWIPYCAKIQEHSRRTNWLTFREIHEGLAVVSESRAAIGAGITTADYFNIRGGISGEYAAFVSVMDALLGGWYEITAGLIANVTIAYPAVAILVGALDWPRLDATMCLQRMAEEVQRLGPSLKYMQTDTGLREYISKLFAYSYPSFNPGELLSPKSREEINHAFGIRDLQTQDYVKSMLPSITWLNDAQDRIYTQYSSGWERLFFPIPLSEFWPPVVWFTDIIARHTDLKTYHETRLGLINHYIASAMWHSDSFSDAVKWCYGGVDGMEKGSSAETQEDVLFTIVKQHTGFDRVHPPNAR